MDNAATKPLAVVTGASSGIGLELAKQLANGYPLLIAAGKERVVSAALETKAQGRAGRFMPDSAKAGMHRKMAEPGSGKN